MAAVTVASGYPIMNVVGNLRRYLYKVTIAADNDTLATPLKKIVNVHANDDTVTAVGIASVSGGTITFHSAAGNAGVWVSAEGW